MSSTKSERMRVTLMLEILGRPPEHLKETLKEIIKQMSEEKGVEVKNNEIYEPVELKEEKSLYTSFAEVDLEVDGIIEIALLIFKYMPSHIEIISPENINITKDILNETLNELIRRLHAYDDIARVLQNEKIILENKFREITENKELTENKTENKIKKKKKSSK
jgi:hypothetical protein